MTQIELLHPWVLFLILLLPLYIFLRLKGLKKRSIPNGHLQYVAAKGMEKTTAYIPLISEALILLVTVCALSTPVRYSNGEVIKEEGIDIALALDISLSMQAADITPNRLEATKEIARDFIRRCGTDRIGIYAFAGHTFTQSPFSSDLSIALTLIDGLAAESIDHYYSGGTAIGDALISSADMLIKHRIEGRDQIVLLITDGESNWGISPDLAARYLKEHKIKTYIIGVGDEKVMTVYYNGKPVYNQNDEIMTTKLDDTQLKEIARAAGGSYYRAKDNEVLHAIFEKISRLSKKPIKTEKVMRQKSFSPLLSACTLVLFGIHVLLQLLIIRRPYR